ncbi:hypothetical protein DFQ14_11296 [Halopolyspora algeriensis]|uniref:Uncharacterized protein n=1 Tax=Halopolyspora algeriensis TaxID=1500506 RepID=A0A368VGD8_9ACTN|nr:hypothetical protein [Halopolyspora algeriensis]RCW40215.1 hypothetical protein DFQ14_11296 [Halopolyspora algeriensis]TQM46304.1 hypothetical protein FHU43_3975 [Halopolyspora algeriensis]
MAGRETALAVLLRKAQWMLDDAAFAVGGGRCAPEQRRVLASALDELSTALRETATEHENHGEPGTGHSSGIPLPGGESGGETGEEVR